MPDRPGHPQLARAVRADKTTYAGLTATFIHYLKEEAVEKIPVWRMISSKPADLEKRATQWAGSIQKYNPSINTSVIPGKSTVGGGSLPGETLPTYLLSLEVNAPDKLLAKLRRGKIPIIARTQDNRVLFDPRTVLIEQEENLLAYLRSVL